MDTDFVSHRQDLARYSAQSDLEKEFSHFSKRSKRKGLLNGCSNTLSKCCSGMVSDLLVKCARWRSLTSGGNTNRIGNSFPLLYEM